MNTAQRSCMAGGKSMFLIELEKKEKPQFCGRLIHYYDGASYKFANAAEAVLKLNAIMDKEGVCLSDSALKMTEKALYLPKETEKIDLLEYRSRGKTVMRIKIYNRQNYSFQGALAYGTKDICFKSALELMYLMEEIRV